MKTLNGIGLPSTSPIFFAHPSVGFTPVKLMHHSVFGLPAAAWRDAKKGSGLV